MSEKAVELIRLAERGERVEKVRDALEMNGDEFAAVINAKAAERGYIAAFDKTKVSRLEAGKMTFLPAEVAVVIMKLDPERRSIDWLVFGDKRAARRITQPPRAAKSSRDADQREAK